MTQISVLTETRTGLPVWKYEFGNASAPRKILILGGVHGDEIEGVWAAQKLLQIFSSHFPYKFHLSLIPQFNPEGVFLKTRMNASGVDLNRNMATRDWSPEIKTPRYHPGPSAGSEPESQALAKLIDQQNFDLILSLHSWLPMLNVNGDCLPFAEILKTWTNYKIDADIGYPTPGCLGTYAGLERQSPTLTYEIERGLDLQSICKIHVPAICEALKIYEGPKS